MLKEKQSHFLSKALLQPRDNEPMDIAAWRRVFMSICNSTEHVSAADANFVLNKCPNFMSKFTIMFDHWCRTASCFFITGNTARNFIRSQMKSRLSFSVNSYGYKPKWFFFFINGLWFEICVPSKVSYCKIVNHEQKLNKSTFINTFFDILPPFLFNWGVPGKLKPV